MRAFMILNEEEEEKGGEIEREDAKEERRDITPHNALVPGEESPCEYHR